MFKDKRATDDAPVLELPDGDPVHVPALSGRPRPGRRRAAEARRLISAGRRAPDGEPLGADELDVPRARMAGAELRVGRRFAVVDAA